MPCFCSLRFIAGPVLLLGLVAAAAPVRGQAPTIVSVSPMRNAVAAPTGGPVVVTFSEPMQNSAATAGAVRVHSAQRGGLLYGGQGGAATVSGTTISFDPTTSFKPGETVSVTTTAAARAASGPTLRFGYVHQFTTAVGGTGTGTFGVPPTGPELGAGPGPVGVTAADVDADGDLDVLAVNATANTVSVYRNTGAGRFGIPQTVAVGATPQALTLGDVDADGDLDLLTANTTANTVSLRLNDGTGLFGGSTDVGVDTGPVAVALADLDADADLDLLTINQYASGAEGSLSVRFNNGPASFGGTANLILNDLPLALAVGDVNADGTLDVVLAAASAFAYVWTNIGAGSLSSTGLVLVGANPRGLALADLDADGDLDLLTANAAANSVSLRFNDGTGRFSGTSDVPVGRNPVAVVVGDVDADGDLDLATTSDIISGALSVARNTGAGSFGAVTTVPVQANPQALALGDLDADGDLDLLATNFIDNTVSIRLNGGTGPPLAIPAATPIVPPTTFAAFPTPAAATAAVHLAGAPPRQLLTIFDAMGRSVRTLFADSTGAATLPAGTLCPGLYLMRTAEGRTTRLLLE